MILLFESLRKTNCIANGWTVGTIVIENNKLPYLEVDGTQRIIFGKNHIIEAYNNNKWERITLKDLKRKTEWEWPLLAGLEARVKKDEPILKLKGAIQ